MTSYVRPSFSDPSLRHRIADATLTLTAGGAPFAGREVVVAQRGHRFLFGCTGGDLVPPRADGGGSPGDPAVPEDQRLAGRFLDLFNFTTLPFYWGGFEPERGRPETERMLKLARWFGDRQAGAISRHYRTLLSHPAVEASTYWGFQDGGWPGAPGGFVRADGTPKPAYDALHSLVMGEWWLSPTTLVTDDDGRVRFSGFLGDYEVSAAGRSAAFTLDTAGEAAAAVTLTLPAS
ncbi:hypothetical protein [Sphaerisporangium corydalis]|uniref:Uncharacterized protein n=1 Tax=Sphaerisporangium corydalis TaxID=1441875 RepID=A0ABV9EII2_9ACTN|nr:hypothetical protein [Sphaerisporangium corydalis]